MEAGSRTGRVGERCNTFELGEEFSVLCLELSSEGVFVRPLIVEGVDVFGVLVDPALSTL